MILLLLSPIVSRTVVAKPSECATYLLPFYHYANSYKVNLWVLCSSALRVAVRCVCTIVYATAFLLGVGRCVRCVDCVSVFHSFGRSTSLLHRSRYHHRPCRRLSFFCAIIDFVVVCVIVVRYFYSVCWHSAAIGHRRIVNYLLNTYIVCDCERAVCAKPCESIQVPKPKSRFNVIINEIAAFHLKVFSAFLVGQKKNTQTLALPNGVIKSAN